MPAVEWIRELAEPYLRGYRPVRCATPDLSGYWFLHSGARRSGGAQAGFFVGYLAGSDWKFLHPDPPECLVFVSVRPVRGSLHRRIVTAPDALVRRTFEYIRWLTHHLPRFSFHEHELPAMVRHTSMSNWPPEKYEHFSRNFFIETLAWLVRSGLVRKLAQETLTSRGSARPKTGPRLRKSRKTPARVR